MAHWLFKSEPDEYSIDSLMNEPDQTGRWDGIRNYQARNILRDQIRLNDEVFFYHSRCKQPAIVGIAKVVQTAYADPAQFNPDNRYFDPKASEQNPRWFCVDIQFVAKFNRPVSLQSIKKHPELESMVLVKQGRLSVQPVTSEQWQTILNLGG